MRSDIPVRVHVGGVEEDEDVLTAHPQRSWVDANTRDVLCTLTLQYCETLTVTRPLFLFTSNNATMLTRFHQRPLE